MYLEAVKLTKKYGKFYALRDLNLKLEGAKCIGYLGPNGAGKTTTLKLFTHLLNPTSGDAIINGYSVKKEMKKALAEVGTLIETPGFYSYLTPRELLEMLCRIRGAKCNIDNALKEVGMYEWRDKKVGKFSKGMKQRIALAAALVTNPEILILDEPTTGMDPKGMAEIREVIISLKKSQRLIFMSSHLLSEVTGVCDEVAMINHGKLLLYDSIDNVVRKFRSRAVEVTFLNEVNTETIMEIEGVKAVENITPVKVTIHIDENAKPHEILRAMIEKGLDVEEFKSTGMALENAYIKMIGGAQNE